jgi:hypothetical protein
MKTCPRCHRLCLNEEDVMNSISHIGNDIKICNECGKQQGLVGMDYCVDIVEIEMENRFKMELGLK